MKKYEIITVAADGEENGGCVVDNAFDVVKYIGEAFDDGYAVYIDRFEESQEDEDSL